jgi:hypothetical protein
MMQRSLSVSDFGNERVPRIRLDLAADQLERLLEVVPTFRSPHVTIAFDDDPAAGLARPLKTHHERLLNPSHREEGR